MGILFIVFVIWFLSYMIKKRNEFNKLRRMVTQASSNIGIEISQRSACLNDALSIAKKNYEHEVSGIDKLSNAEQLKQLQYLGDKYPTLRATEGYNRIIGEAIELDKNIAAQRTIVNGNIREYNDAITAFPALIIAFILRYKTIKFIDEENIEENRKLDKTEVDFSKF